MKKTVATLAILTLASAMPLAAEAKITPNGTSGIKYPERLCPFARP